MGARATTVCRGRGAPGRRRSGRAGARRERGRRDPGAGTGSAQLPPPLDPPLAPWPGEQVQVGGRTLFVRRAGAAGAEPAVFVHGLGGASTNWTDLMFLLRGRYDCWAPDLPGFGRSEAAARR